MLSIVAPAHCEPLSYELNGNVPEPTISDSHDVIIKVHAASVNPIDLKKAAGVFKIAIKERFPYQIGYDCAGEVTAIGRNVSKLKVGDQVYTRLPEAYRGSWAEYAKCPDRFVAKMPSNMSFAHAAAIPLAALTAMQALQKYKGSLAGKTVFVPAGLSGTGSMACQLAKNVFHAGKVITTVSTSKISRVPELLGEGVVDQIIDYTTESPLKVIPPQSVDFLFDTTGQAMEFLPLMIPSTSLIISIATQPSGTQLQDSGIMDRPDKPKLPWYILMGLNLVDSGRKFYARRSGVEYAYWFMEPNAEDLDALRANVEDGLLRPVVGKQVDIRDIDGVREACKMVFDGKGGVGKTVFRVT
ncbi:GroES-like protein [Paraphaeosphaeria sporulosa]|uniref:GroES-like protein n=1 Tax=Paraphaeosphaeria sporulosa TaxID=1460663 RepID=A0A177CF17_9PLEO|nr:GroES-like protein [Paraphaeosphaeria sporulosa]OAG05791.1 GroES-like protein [Paraphaeosphaeria sporulosa]